MRFIVLFILVVVSTSTGIWGIDSSRMQYWENSLGSEMGNSDEALLQRQAEDLALTMKTRQDDAVMKIKAALVHHNLSRQLYPKGIMGNASKAVHLFQEVRSSSVDEELKAIALIFLGSSQTLEGAEDSNPIVKLFAVNQGCGTLDQAVSQFGNETYLARLTRAGVYLALPDFFGKLQQAGEDLATLQNQVRVNPSRIPAPAQAQIAYLSGNFAKKNKNLDTAIEQWRRAVQLDPEKKGAGKPAAEALEPYQDEEK